MRRPTTAPGLARPETRARAQAKRRTRGATPQRAARTRRAGGSWLAGYRRSRGLPRALSHGSRGRPHEPLESLDSTLEHAHGRPEGEPHVPLETRRAPVAALAGVHVEELTRHDDDLLLERRAEERHPVTE